jgi:hypothetical protein
MRAVPQITDHSRANIERALQRAARAFLPRDPGDTCLIVENREPPTAAPGEKLILVTISSFKFRLLLIFHIDAEPALASYFQEQGAQRGIEEAFYEIANMCCGTLNRDMAHDFKHLAMSVPYTLAGPCMEYIADVRPEYISRSTVTINDNVRVRLTLCLCCSAPVSFSATGAEREPESDSGKLELF